MAKCRKTISQRDSLAEFAISQRSKDAMWISLVHEHKHEDAMHFSDCTIDKMKETAARTVTYSLLFTSRLYSWQIFRFYLSIFFLHYCCLLLLQRTQSIRHNFCMNALFCISGTHLLKCSTNYSSNHSRYF